MSIKEAIANVAGLKTPEAYNDLKIRVVDKSSQLIDAEGKIDRMKSQTSKLIYCYNGLVTQIALLAQSKFPNESLKLQRLAESITMNFKDKELDMIPENGEIPDDLMEFVKERNAMKNEITRFYVISITETLAESLLSRMSEDQ